MITSPIGDRLPFSVYAHKDHNKQKEEQSSHAISPLSRDLSLIPTISEIECTISSIEKAPGQASQMMLDSLFAKLLEIEPSRARASLMTRFSHLYSLSQASSKDFCPAKGKLSLASFNQFDWVETRSSCAANVASFVKHFLDLKEMAEIDIDWVEKATREGMHLS